MPSSPARWIGTALAVVLLAGLILLAVSPKEPPRPNPRDHEQPPSPERADGPAVPPDPAASGSPSAGDPLPPVVPTPAPAAAVPDALRPLREKLYRGGNDSQEAAEELARIGTVDAIRLLLDALNPDYTTLGEEGALRAYLAAVEALHHAPPEAAPAIEQMALTYETGSGRATAASALTEVAPERSTPVLTRLLAGDTDAGVRDSVASLLGKVPASAASFTALQTALFGDASPQVRATAAVTLSQQGDAARPVLQTALAREQDPSVRDTLRAALGGPP